MERPNINESEEDLIKQDKILKSKLEDRRFPAATVVRIGKRKTEENISSRVDEVEKEKRETGSKPKSRFAESRLKKKKEGIVDHTVLPEAVSGNIARTAVLKPVTAKNIPSLNSAAMHWQPMYTPYGFPRAPQLNISSKKDEDSSNLKKRKSHYLVHLEKDMATKEDQVKFNLSSSGSCVDEKLADLGNESFILDGKSGLANATEALKIHSENIAMLSQLSHEERIRERNEILARLNPEQVKFVQSLRLKKQDPSTLPNESLLKNEISLETVKNITPISNEEQVQEMDVTSETLSNGNSGSKTEDMVVVEEESNVKDLGLPISPEEAKNWVHMDKVELDKLKWMTNVPKPKPLKGLEGFVARFNFNGDLLPYDSDISWREGLHHHGEEPGRAGYTLDELFIFVRSQVVQQRHLGLKTLANILRNAKEGLYDTCLDTPIIQLMVDAGLVLLLRFAIDDTTPLVYQDALTALYFLVVSEPDEQCLSVAEPWTPLGAQPQISSVTYSKEKNREELVEEEKELKDVEVIKLDIVRALVRMDVHIRLRYLLESVTLAPPDVIHILGILKRIARHSLNAAWALVRTPRLLATITKHFLPHNISSLLSGSNVGQLDSLYGVPLSQALSFMKVLISQGRQIANTLVENHDIVGRVMAYVSVEPTEVQMPLQEMLSLAQEAYCTWSLLLNYGLSKAQQGISTFYPLFVKQLLFYRDKVDINMKIESNQFNYEIGAHMVNVLTKGLSVAATKQLLTSRMERREASEDAKEVLQPPILNWSDFEELLTLSEICLTKWISQLVRDHASVSFSGFKLLGSFCSFVNVYLDNWRDQSCFEGVAFHEKICHLHSKVFSPILNSETCNYLILGLRNHSALCSTLSLGNIRDPVNLGSVCSVCKGGELTPIIQTSSPFPFLLPFLTLLKNVHILHPTLEKDMTLNLLNDKHFEDYLSEICKSKHSLASQWHTRIEIYTIENILHLASLKGCRNRVLYHQTGLALLPIVHKEDEHIVKSLFRNIVCNLYFVDDLSEIETQVDTLGLKEQKSLRSPALYQPSVAPIELTLKLLKNLPLIGQDFAHNLLHSKLLKISAVRNKCIPYLINNLTLKRDDDVLALGHYWCLEPLIYLLHLTTSAPKTEDVGNQTHPNTVLSTIKWLQMTFLMLRYRKEVCSLHTSSMGWFRHLSNVFLASNDLFLDINVSSYTQACLLSILDNGGYKHLDWSATFPDLQPCYDWYKAMLSHYASVSYGDSCFAMFVIIPLIRKWPSSYKLLLFGEHSDTLPFIRLTTKEVAEFIPIEAFLSPIEEDENVIFRYKSAVANQSVSEIRTPFLHYFVSYHISKFCQTKKDKDGSNCQ